MNNSVLRKIGMSMGPLIGCLMFLILGNVWEKEICKIVVFTGFISKSICKISLMFFRVEF